MKLYSLPFFLLLCHFIISVISQSFSSAIIIITNKQILLFLNKLNYIILLNNSETVFYVAKRLHSRCWLSRYYALTCCKIRSLIALLSTVPLIINVDSNHKHILLFILIRKPYGDIARKIRITS